MELHSPDRRPRIPRAVWALGFVSMFMDISSEIIHALLPLFLTTTLGVSVAMVGLIDGIAEATASITKASPSSNRIGNWVFMLGPDLLRRCQCGALLHQVGLRWPQS